MIFVTVGMHEQPFNRLIRQMDVIKEQGLLDDEVVMQTGYSTYRPKHCTCWPFLPYQEMERYMSEARIVVTHGGPSSFIMPLQMGKIPVVVPRQKKFGEHVNDHQKIFAEELSARMGKLLVVTEIEKLGDVLRDYDRIVSVNTEKAVSNNAKFNQDLKKIVQELFDGSGEVSVEKYNFHN